MMMEHIYSLFLDQNPSVGTIQRLVRTEQNCGVFLGAVQNRYTHFPHPVPHGYAKWMLKKKKTTQT